MVAFRSDAATSKRQKGAVMKRTRNESLTKIGGIVLTLAALALNGHAQDNTTTTDVSVKFYVSVRHVDLSHSKSQSTAPAAADSGKYVTPRLGGEVGGLGRVGAAIDKEFSGGEKVSGDGNAVKNGLKPAGSVPAANKSGEATLTMTGTAKLFVRYRSLVTMMARYGRDLFQRRFW